MTETERESIRESTLEGLDAAARKGKHGGRPPVITEDMLHTVLRRRASGESVEQIQPDLIIPAGKRKGQAPSVASIYRALAEHEKKEAYPEAVAAAHADFANLQDADDIPRPRRVRIRRPDDPLTPDEADLPAAPPGPGPPALGDRLASKINLGATSCTATTQTRTSRQGPVLPKLRRSDK
ncbi:hypothetical protein ACM9HC_32700 [Streptomyces sp. JAC18]|uniref:hypothetical protein n=1 Tax=Streptomyces sp. JAC18 TaxID=3418414 RepID=UPI003D81ABFC